MYLLGTKDSRVQIFQTRAPHCTNRRFKKIFFHLLLKKSRDFPGVWIAGELRRIDGFLVVVSSLGARGNEAVLWTFIHLFLPSWTRGFFLVKFQAFSQLLILLTNPKPDIFLRLISISSFLPEL